VAGADIDADDRRRELSFGDKERIEILRQQRFVVELIDSEKLDPVSRKLG